MNLLCIQGSVLLLTICAAGIGGTFQFGYNLSIISAPTLPIQEFINETWQVHTGQPLPDHLVLLVWSLIVSLYPLGGLFGALLAGPLAIILGRKKSLLVNNIFVVATATLFGFSHRPGSFEMVMLGRLPLGVSAGVSMNVQPMYLGESIPKELRGAVAITSVIFTALGIVIGQVVGLRELLGDPQAWHLLLASCLVLGVLQLAFLPLLPESPRYLLIDRGDMEACLAALQRLRGTTEVVEELAELEEERIFCQGRRALRPWELFQDRGLWRQVTSLMVLGSALELCGTNSVYAYASSVFREAGIPEGKVQYAIVGTGSCELLVACISCAVIEMVGRRKLLIAGYGLMACCGSIFTVGACRAPSLGCPTWPCSASLPSSSALALALVSGPKELCTLGFAEGTRMSSRMTSGYKCKVTRMPCPLYWGFWEGMAGEEDKGPPLLCWGQGGSPGWQPLSLLFLLAGVTGILAMELFDQKARPAASMVCGVLMWTMLFLVGLGFPFIMEGLCHFLYVPFLGVCVCGTICTGFFLPKTKGKTFLEISEELHRLNFPRQSQGPEWLGPEVIQATDL